MVLGHLRADDEAGRIHPDEDPDGLAGITDVARLEDIADELVALERGLGGRRAGLGAESVGAGENLFRLDVDEIGSEALRGCRR